METYRENRDVMRFHYHHIAEIGSRLRDLNLPRREYASDMAEIAKVGMFITDDEIDATLTRWSSVDGGKGRIYGFLQMLTTPKKKLIF